MRTAAARTPFRKTPKAAPPTMTNSISQDDGTSENDQTMGVSTEPLLSSPPTLQQLDVDEESPATTRSRRADDDDGEHNESYYYGGFSSFFWAASPTSKRPSSPLQSSENERSYPMIVEAWESILCRIRVPLLLFVVLVVWPLGAVCFRHLTSATDSTFHPIPTSLSGQAQTAFAESYADDWQDPMHPSLSIVLENPDSASNDTLVDPRSPLYEPAFHFSTELPIFLNQTCWKLQDGTARCSSNETWTKVTSYFSLLDDQLTYLAKSAVANEGRMTVVQVQYLLPSNSMHTRARVAQLMEAIEVFAARYEDTPLSITFTGLKWFQSDLIKSTQSDMRKMDALVLPLALFLLGVVLKQARAAYVWILPLCTLLTTVCAWSMVMRVVASNMQITQFTPSIMMSVTLGMGMDYSLFLLSRYLEEMTTTTTRSSRTKQQAIRHMLYHGGHVLLLSGLTLMCTFLGLCFLPLAMLKSVGIGAAVAIGCALFVQLTLVPAVLHTRFGDLIVEGSAVHRETERDGDDADDSFLERAALSQADAAEPSIWKKLSRHLLHREKSIIIFLVIVQLILPVALYATSFNSSLSFDLMLPSTSPSLDAFHRLGAQLGWGRLTPYRILFDGRAAGIKMDSAEGFDVMHRVLDELIAIEGHEDKGITHIATGMDEIQGLTDHLMDTLGLSARSKMKDGVLCDQDMIERPTMYGGISILKNARIPHSLFVSAKYCAKVAPHCPVETLHLIDYVDQVSTSKDRYATFVTATLGTNPFSSEGLSWLEAARSTLKRLEDGGALGDIKVYLEGTAAIEYDAVDAVYSAFPLVIGITMAVVFILMGVFFRSLLAPLRSVVSISLTLSFVFGWLVLVYQHGILDWTGIQKWTSTGDEISWLVPVMAFSIIVGLALDYDVFLISRILEYRTDEGYDHKSSIAAGLDSTGSIITAAGLIMGVAFGGLMFSSSPVLYQWSFLLTTAVLLDTFVIRTLIVPIVMGWTGSKYSWWPRQMPDAGPTVQWYDSCGARENGIYQLMENERDDISM